MCRRAKLGLLSLLFMVGSCGGGRNSPLMEVSIGGNSFTPDSNQDDLKRVSKTLTDGYYMDFDPGLRRPASSLAVGRIALRVTHDHQILDLCQFFERNEERSWSASAPSVTLPAADNSFHDAGNGNTCKVWRVGGFMRIEWSVTLSWVLVNRTFIISDQASQELFGYHGDSAQEYSRILSRTFPDPRASKK